MALSGLDIYKLLPKTNCKKCGSPTCLAFAMKLAMKKASLDECPDITAEARKALEESSRPPIALIKLGSGDNVIEIGGETVLFRHEKTFYHEPAIAISLDDTLNEAAFLARIKEIEKISFERVGQHIAIDMIALINKSSSSEKFLSALDRVLLNSKKSVILISSDPKIIESALKKCSDKRPLVYAADSKNLKDMCAMVKAYKAPLALKAKTLEELDKLSMEASGLGIEEIVLDPGFETLRGSLNDLTQIRRLSLKRNYRPFGFPVIVFIHSPAAETNGGLTSVPSTQISSTSVRGSIPPKELHASVPAGFIKNPDKYQTVISACTFIAKYAGIIVLDSVEEDVLLPIITMRQNIFTDPQKPVTVEPKLYKFGSPDKNSPIMVTTNFSLTFYTVTPEIEASGHSAYLLVTDSEGMSVLTAWAAEKFTPEIIADTMKKTELDTIVAHKKIIIPGYVAVLSGKLEDISGWEVLVGPKEASGIPKYLKEIWKT